MANPKEVGPLAGREGQAYPVLTAAQIENARRFASGPEQTFAPGQDIYAIGDRDAPAWLVLRGEMDAIRRDGLHREAVLTTHRAGQLSGEVNQLAGRPTIAAGRAGPEGMTALPFDPAHLRALMVGSADIGEIVMRALILRRVGLIAEGGAGTIIIGSPGSPHVVEIQNYLTRGGSPNLVLDSATDDEGKALVERLGLLPDELPLVVCPNGNMLRNPKVQSVAACLGTLAPIDPDQLYDVAIVGSGPAGLAAAVYAASEGLSVIVIEEHAVGGQAGASMRIENYLGFPTGITGQALAGRAFNQALKFGVQIVAPLSVERLDCDAKELTLVVDGDRRIQAKAVVVASGARYRRPAIANLAACEGNGISYWASPIEARLCAGEDIALVGGGNSAGQAVVYLAPQVRRLHLFVRRDLSFTMSRYLIDRIAALPNVVIHVDTEVAAIEGDAATGLSAATFRNRTTGSVHRCDLRHLFLFIGADPNAGWLKGCVDTDAHGFVLTGGNELPLETSRAGVFAIGDVRAGSTKRVAAAVGEGAAVVAQIHAMLAKRAESATS